jgi:alginate biosynthesis protein AlgX
MIRRPAPRTPLPSAPWWRRGWAALRGALGGAALCGLVLAAAPALAQSSAFGCTDLGGRHRMASLEGRGGTFFRIVPDMRLIHPFADETVALMAALADTLAAQGTTLVYLPLPPKSLALPDALPPEARDWGFDEPLAATLYDDILRRLDERGVVTVNARTALRVAGDAAPTFHGTDPRITAEGARRLARAVADRLATVAPLAGLPKDQFTTRATGTTRLPSAYRAILQRHCLVTLPEVMAETFATSRSDGVAAGDSLMATGAGIALLGTEDAGDPSANLAGFLAEATGLAVQAYAVPEGGAFAAISSYMTSRAFAEARPKVIVWAVPVADSLAAHGDGPLRELIAAAGDTCRTALPVGPGMTPGTLLVDLAGADPGRPGMLFVDTGLAAASRIEARFTGPDGQARSAWLARHPRQLPTGRFYIPLDGLVPGGARQVEIVSDGGVALDARAALCQGTP